MGLDSRKIPVYNKIMLYPLPRRKRGRDNIKNYTIESLIKSDGGNGPMKSDNLLFCKVSNPAAWLER